MVTKDNFFVRSYYEDQEENLKYEVKLSSLLFDCICQSIIPI